MKVGFFQFSVAHKNPESNLDYIESRIAGRKYDLLVLPELFTSGYAFESKEEIFPYAESLEDSNTIKRLAALVPAPGDAIVGTIPEKDGDNIYNTAIFVSTEGLMGYQRKIHLTDYEKNIFTPGNEAKVFACEEFKVGAMICFDSWFSPLSAKLRQLGADVLCNPACFGGDVTPKILPIRALENQCFVISCNRVGIEIIDGVEEVFRGESQVIDPDGEVLYKAEDEEELVFVKIELDEVGKPRFGSQIKEDFQAEHSRYKIDIL